MSFYPTAVIPKEARLGAARIVLEERDIMSSLGVAPGRG
jgi:hypothetical protein